MRGKKSLFLVLVFLSIILQPVLAIDDYGEDEDYLGQIVDDYTNETYVQSKTNMINNETLDCMELSVVSGEGGPIYQNLSIYTEVDSDADLTVTDRMVTWSTMDRDSQSWIVYDFGADYFEDFYCNFTLDFSDIEAGDTSNRDTHATCMFSNTIGTFADNIGGDLLTILTRQVASTDDIYRYAITQYTGGVLDFFAIDTTNYAMPRHYGTLERTGNTITLRIYTDETRTTLIETLTDTGNTEKYRYFHVIASYDTLGDPADHSSGLVANVTFERGEGYPDGHYYTVEMLDGDRGLVLMYNATIPTGTGITVELSDDNSTWVDHNGVGGSDTLIAGFESLDLRDLNTTSLYMRFNFTTDGVYTPRIYQARLVTITDIIPGACKIHIFNASSITVIAGTLNDGNLASTHAVDGDWYNVSEVVETPGLDVRFNFTGIGENATCGCVDVYHTYTGHPQHVIEIQVWNFTSSSWYQVGTLIYNETAGWECSGLGHDVSHFFYSEMMWARFYHEDQGHIPHEMHVDSIKLNVVYAEECPPCEEAPALVAMGKFYALAIILLILGLLLGLGMRKR